jgi:hypothetical protein
VLRIAQGASEVGSRNRQARNFRTAIGTPFPDERIAEYLHSRTNITDFSLGQVVPEAHSNQRFSDHTIRQKKVD